MSFMGKVSWRLDDGGMLDSDGLFVPRSLDMRVLGTRTKGIFYRSKSKGSQGGVLARHRHLRGGIRWDGDDGCLFEFWRG